MKKNKEELQQEIKSLQTQLESLENELNEVLEAEFLKKEKQIKNQKKIISKFDKDGKEYFEIPEEKIEDYTQEYCTWKIMNEEFDYVDKQRVNGDGEWWRVIVKRKRDGKYFRFSWGYSEGSGNYYYEPEWKEVTPKKTEKTEWN